MDPTHTIIPGLNDNPGGTNNRYQPKSKGGRPTTINDPWDTDDDGQPRTAPDAILHHVRQVEFLDTACHLAGVNVKKAKGWLTDGARAGLKGDGQPLTEHDLACMRFRTGYLTAKAEREKLLNDASDELIRGGRRIATVKRTRVFRNAQDTQGRVVKQEETTTTLPPDGAQLRWRMAVGNPRRYSQKLQVALDDDLGDLPEDELRDSLADRVEAYLEGVVVGESTTVDVPEGPLALGWFSDPGDVDDAMET